VAIYHLSAKVISRSAGRSATAAAAYRSGERIADERTGQAFDYTRRSGVEHREILRPADAPAWMGDRAQLWNAVEKIEARKDAQLAREIEVAIPRELDREARQALVREFVTTEFVARGMIADVAWHMGRASDGGQHPHAHVLLTMRALTGEGFGPKNRDWNDRDLLEGWRERWAEHANRALERAGHEERIDHRSHKARGLEREPEPKLGSLATQRDQAEIRAAANENRAYTPQTERGQAWQAVRERNRMREQLAAVRAAAERVLVEARERLDALWARLETAVTALRERFGEGRDVRHGVRPDPIPDAAALLGKREPPAGDRIGPDAPAPALRDALLGRAAAPEIGAAVEAVTPAALLGAVLPAIATPAVTTTADLLGKGLTEPDKSRSDRDGGRDR